MTRSKLVRSVFVFCAATAIASPAQTFTTLVSFDGADGRNPEVVSLIQGTDGNFYGLSTLGGANGGNDGDGTLYKITPQGRLTTLYNFCSQDDCSDGRNPYGALVQGTNGNFYGVTGGGGSSNNYGTVFEITPEGALTTLQAFDGIDGNYPVAGLVQDPDGSFYGTTGAGGANGDGTVFKMTAAGTLATLNSFDGTDGDSPNGALVQGTNGDFYGVTYLGGANCTAYGGCGTIFKITPGGTLTALYSFCSQTNCTDGGDPYGTLVQASNGNFYGTTAFGGAHDAGTVFQITLQGTLTTLYNFCSQPDCTDGDGPFAGLVRGSDGNFYGTAGSGGINGDGTVFKITPGGTLTTVHSFDGDDGESPLAGLFQGTNGILYGTTYAGGADGYGTVFSVDLGLSLFVETEPSSGTVGANVTILGTDLTGATSVTFNGTAATFTVVSASEITTTVPADAATGTVEVTTPSGTLKSNVVFTVTK